MFRMKVWNHYLSGGKRDMPWRHTRDAYRILVSEVMLQQTQVERVIPKYEAFLKNFPSVSALAKAPRSEVLTLCPGLGYNRRALNLHKAAKEIVQKYGGEVPLDIEALDSLSGIGRATAGAIYVYATNKPASFVETNVRTVFIHEFFPKAKKVTDRELQPLIETAVDQRNPREWHYALMDYGVFLKKSVGNLSRKSTSYAKQSKFEGSVRQLRGALIRAVVRRGALTMVELEALFPKEKRFTRVLGALIAEGFLTEENGRILIPR